MGGGDLIWSFGAFELDAERYELRRSGEVIELRRKVFDVLRYLVTHHNRLISKEQLLQGVWPGETIHEAVVAQNIAILRKVLGDSREAAEVIQTVYGRGYRFVADVRLVEPPAPEPIAQVRHAGGQPFVGREHVMNELRSLLRQALAGAGRFAVITGEPGIGKTRTSEELAADARALGARVLVGRCHESEGAPAYWPWVQILRAASEGDRALAATRPGADGVDAARLLGELRGHSGSPRPSPLDSPEARFRLFDGVSSLLSRHARAQPLLVIFDDLHWADEATLHLLRFLSRELRALPLLVLGTSRDIDMHADPATLALLSSLIGGTHVHRVYLKGLSVAATCELCTATLQHDLGASTLRELHALTDGNPFFVQEVLRLFADVDGNGRDDRWRRSLPGRVREVIDLRLQGLGAQAQRLLALASVIGRDFSAAVLAEVAALPRAELLALLEAAAKAKIVRALSDAEPGGDGELAPSGHYRFAHALIRESLYGALSEPERVRLHEQVGRALEALFGVDADAHASELAHHFYRAASGGDVERAVSYCMRAAEQALDLLAFEQAVFHYQRALEALACRLPIDEQRRFQLKLALGSALFRAGEDGNPALLGAAEIARRLGRPDLLGQVVLSMCGWPRVGRRGHTTNRELYPLLSEAIAAPLQDAPALRSRLLSVLALNCDKGTALCEQVARGHEALQLARALGDDEALYDALLSRLRLMQAPEDAARRVELAGELLAVAQRLGQKERIFTAHELRVQPLLALGDLTGADQEIATCEQLAAELRLPRCELQVLRFRLERALGDGSFDQIRPLTEQAVRARGLARTSPGYRVSLFAWVTFERALRGDYDWFEHNVGKLAADVDAHTFMRSHVAYLYALFGRLDEARGYYQPLLERDVLDGPHDEEWLMTLALTADAVAACRDRAAAEAIYPRLLPHAALNVSHFEMLVYLGSCAHWLGQLAALRGERRAAAAHFDAALEMNTRLGARPALARTQLAYASLLLDRENGRGCVDTRGRALLRDATRLAQELGMERVAAEAGDLARAGRLSASSATG